MNRVLFSFVYQTSGSYPGCEWRLSVSPEYLDHLGRLRDVLEIEGSVTEGLDVRGIARVCNQTAREDLTAVCEVHDSRR